MTEPMPLVNQPGTPLRLARDTHRFPDGERPVVAGVSAFGTSGAIGHLVLTEFPVSRPDEDREERPGHLLPLSARHTEALRQTAERYAELLGGDDKPSLADVCHTAGVRRTHFERRVAVVGANREELVAGLAAVVAGRGAERVVGDGRELAGPPAVVFVYPGQGSQWPGMARELLRCNRTFADRFAECDRAVRAEVGWSPADHIENGDTLSTMDRVQPVLWAVQVALAELWRDWGVEPDLVIGHSMGEVAAAVTAGALTVAEGAAVICRRSALIAEERTPGAMWAVQLGEQAARRVVEEHAGQVRVGVTNSHRATVLSGDPAALAEIAGKLREDGVFCRQVQVDYASHAPQVEPLRPKLLDALADLRPRPGRVPIRSTVLDRVVDGAGFDAAYWADNLILPVRFAAAVRSAVADRRPTLFVEISAHPILHSALEDGIEEAGADAVLVASLRRDEPELVTLLASLATVYTEGGQVAFDRVAAGRFVDVPKYPWQHKRFWVDGPGEQPDRPAGPPVALLDTRPPAELAEATATAPGIARYLCAAVSTLLGLPEVDPAAAPAAQGLDSVFAARLAYQLQAELGVQVKVSDLLTARSLTELARDLRARRQVAPDGEPVPTGVGSVG